MASPVTNVQIRQGNLRALLRAARDRGPLTKRELQTEAQLSWCTVSVLMTELEAQGLVVPISKSGALGRKAIAYDIASSEYFTVGVDLDHQSLRLAVTDLKGRVAAERQLMFAGATMDAVLSDLRTVLHEQLAAFADKRVLGVGIAAQGLVDAKQGVLRHMPLIADSDGVALCDWVTADTGLPCVLLHDPDAILLAERQWGDAGLHTRRYAALLRLDSAVGISLLIDGKMYAGGHGLPGDLDHLPVNAAGPRCSSCGRVGCLHEYVSRGGLVRRYVEALRARGQSPGRPYNADDFPALVEGARAGDELCLSLFAQAGHYLGTALNALHNMLDLEEIVMYGEWLALRPLWEASFWKQYRLGLKSGEMPAVRYSCLGTDAAARGAALHAAERWIDREDFGIFSEEKPQ